MSQNDFSLANQGFPSMRADMNSAFQALASNSSGTTAPSTTYAHQWWYDEANNILKMRNSDNDAWINFASFDQTSNNWFPYVGGEVLTATGNELNVLDGITATVTELNYTDGVTSNIQAQLDNKPSRNLIINGSGRINQRGYTSGTATSGANQFTLDRWFVVVSGQSLTFTGTDVGRVMTAPAGGVRQVVEGANVIGGDYVLNWTGTATATVNGAARAKGEVFTLPAGDNVVVSFTSGTFSNVQLERGTVATPFETLAYSTELARCLRYYYQPVALDMRVTGTATSGVQPLGDLIFHLPVPMRTIPTVNVSTSGGVNVGAITVAQNQYTVRLSASTFGTGYATYLGRLVAADAEITS